MNRNVGIKFLKEHLHRVDAVNNGRKAFDAFVTNKYDVILMVSLLFFLGVDSDL